MRSKDEDLHKKVERLEREVSALRGEVQSGQEIRKVISANQWIVTDQKKFDQLLVINFEVLNLAYKRLIKEQFPSFEVEEI